MNRDLLGHRVANHTALNQTGPTSDGSGWGGIQDWFADPENQLLVRLLATALTLLIAWALIRLTRRALERSARRIGRMRRMDDYQVKVMVGRTRPMLMTVTIVMLVLSAISIMGIWGLQTAFTGLLAGAGFAGIVIGLAAADTIGDVIAGFLIFYNHPFDIGDWVEIDGQEGIVEDVALGATTLISWDNEKITIPNRLVEGQKIKNFSHYRKLRRKVLVGVEYGTDLQKAMQLMEGLARAHPLVLQEPEPSVVTMGFGSSSVDLALRFYVEPIRSSAIAVYTDLLRQVHDTFRREGIGIAFPHMQIVQGNAWKLDGSG